MALSCVVSALIGLIRLIRRQTLVWLQSQAHRVNAVAQSGRLGAVVEDMAEMSAAVVAMHFCPAHEQAVVCFRSDVLAGGWLPEARPP